MKVKYVTIKEDFSEEGNEIKFVVIFEEKIGKQWKELNAFQRYIEAYDPESKSEDCKASVDSYFCQRPERHKGNHENYDSDVYWTRDGAIRLTEFRSTEKPNDEDSFDICDLHYEVDTLFTDVKIGQITENTFMELLNDKIQEYAHKMPCKPIITKIAAEDMDHEDTLIEESMINSGYATKEFIEFAEESTIEPEKPKDIIKCYYCQEEISWDDPKQMWLHNGLYLYCPNNPVHKAIPFKKGYHDTDEFYQDNPEKPKEDVIVSNPVFAINNNGKIIEFVNIDPDDKITISDKFAEAIKAKIMPKVDVSDTEKLACIVQWFRELNVDSITLDEFKKMTNDLISNLTYDDLMSKIEVDKKSDIDEFHI